MWGLYIHTDASKLKPKRIPKPTPFGSTDSIPKPFSFLFQLLDRLLQSKRVSYRGRRNNGRVIEEGGTINSTQFNPIQPYQFNPYHSPTIG